MKEEKLIEFVKPLYAHKDSMHDFKHIIKIKKRVNLYKKDYKNINEQKLRFLVYFHGLKKYVKENEQKIIDMEFPKDWINALYRHTKNPKTIEEKLVSDANLQEIVGKGGIKRTILVGRERNQTMKQTLKIMKDNINKARFYTKKGKELGEPGIKIVKDFLKKNGA